MKISNDALFRGHGSDLHTGLMVDFCLITIMPTGIELNVIACMVTMIACMKTKVTENQLVTVISIDHVTSPGSSLGERRTWEMPASLITRMVVHTPRGTDGQSIYWAIRHAPSRVRFYRLGEREAACRIIGDIAEKENDGCLGMPEFLQVIKEAQAKMVTTP